MQYEFSCYLAELLKKSAILERYGLEETGILSALQSPEKQLEISRPPAHIDEWLASPICFEIAKAARVSAKTPVEAVELVELLCQTAASDSPFVLQLGGKGYVNATPRASFVELYLDQVIENAAVVLRCFRSVRRETETNESVRCCALPSMSWAELLRRAMKRKSGTDVHVLAERSQSSNPDFDRALMILSLLADEEIAIEPYLQGLSGRQNTPWYINRFRNDVAKVNEVNAEAKRPSSFAGKKQAVTRGSSRGARPNLAIDQGIERVLSLRSAYLRAELRAEPEIVLAELLDLIRSFYAIYNDPMARAFLFENGEERDSVPNAHRSRKLVKALSAAVFDGLGAMDAEFHKDS